MRINSTFLGFATLFALTACGGGAGTASPDVPTSAGSGVTVVNTPTTVGVPVTLPGVTTLAPGATVTLLMGQIVSVPAGTSVRTPDGSTINISGTSNTVNVAPGSIVSVPASATGPANNTINAGAAATVGDPNALQTTLVAGNSNLMASGGVDGVGVQAAFSGFGQITADVDGNLIAIDRGSLRKITPAGVVTTLFPGMYIDWLGLAVDASGNLYGVNSAMALVKLSPSGVLTTLNDHWKTKPAIPDGPERLAIDSAGNIYAADFGGKRVVKFTPDGTMSELAGASASLRGPSALALDAQGNVYVNDSSAIRKFTPAGVMTTPLTFAGRIIPSDGPIAVDSAGNVYVATENPTTIIRLDPKGNAMQRTLANPSAYVLAMTADAAGNVYIGTGWASPSQIWKLAK